MHIAPVARSNCWKFKFLKIQDVSTPTIIPPIACIFSECQRAESLDRSDDYCTIGWCLQCRFLSQSAGRQPRTDRNVVRVAVSERACYWRQLACEVGAGFSHHGPRFSRRQRQVINHSFLFQCIYAACCDRCSVVCVSYLSVSVRHNHERRWNSWTNRGAIWAIDSGKKVACTRLPSGGFLRRSRFLAVSLQVTWVINPAIGWH